MPSISKYYRNSIINLSSGKTGNGMTNWGKRYQPEKKKKGKIMKQFDVAQ